MRAATGSDPRARGPARRWRPRRDLPEHWPLTALLAGFPLWWLLGVAEFVPMLLAIPMLRQLARRRQVVLPPGFAIWALFLVWVVVGVLVLTADAPGAVPGGNPLTRTMVFGYRFGWYAACTVVLVWLGNADPRLVSFRRVTQLMAGMFLVTTAGGILGLLAPELEMRSLFELLLPRSLTSNAFVESLVHIETADVQTVLGREEPRPKAPFAFANSWGSNFSLYLPFFVLAWIRHGKAWQRALAPVVLVLAAFPVVYSLNRGLWLSLAVGALFVTGLALRRGRPALILATVVTLGAVAVGVAASPLGATLQERLDNQHSNDRRSQLLEATVHSTATGSPVVGFGSTRDVQGAFSSIAGGATPECPACGVPALGTQGHLWMVVFSQGLVGAALFLAFFVRAAAGSWRCRTETQVLASVVLLFFFLQLPVYDTLGMPLFTVMTAVALAWRERRHAQRELRRRATWRAASSAVKERAVAAGVLVAVGATVGAGILLSRPSEASARTSILLEPSPVSLAADALDPEEVNPTTVDTEAALALADRSLRLASSSLDSRLPPAVLRDRMSVTASANTRVLHLEVRAADADAAVEQVSAVARAYLTVRQEYLEQRRSQVLELLAEKRREITSAGILPTGDTVGVTDSEVRRLSREVLVATTKAVLLSPTTAGEVIRAAQPQQVGRQAQVGLASGAALGAAAGSLLLLLPAQTLRSGALLRRLRRSGLGARREPSGPELPEAAG